MIDKDAKGFKGNTPLKLGSSKSAKKSTSRTVVTPGTKVSQATIDKIKGMGMSAALKSASGASAEMKEGIRRLYGAKRFEAATKSSSSVPAQKSTPEKGTGFKRVSPYPYSGVKVKGSGRPAGAPGAISGSSRNTAPSAISGKKVSATASKKAAPAKRQSDAEKMVGGIKRVLNSSPGPSIKKALTSSNKTTATAATRRKAASDALKRAGGRSM